MFGREHGSVPPEAREFKAPEVRQTPDSVRRKVDLALGLIFSEFKVEGKDKLIKDQQEHPDAKYLVAGSHFSGHDVQSAIRALGDRLDLQVTGESMVLDMPHVKLQVKAIGEDRFTPLTYRQAGEDKVGVFRPKDFDPLIDQMNAGRTPWVAAHPFSMKEEMRESKVGPVYLAQKTGARIVPTTVAVEGGSTRFITGGDMLRQVVGKLRGKAKATYKVGEPIELPKIDVNIIDTVLNKRAAGEKVNPEERAQFSEVHKQLKEQAELITEAIAQLVPEEQRGAYAEQEVEGEQV